MLVDSVRQVFQSGVFYDLIGFVGFVFYMLSYGMLQFGRIAGDSYWYAVLNIVAAILVLISLAAQFNLASLLIQLAWIVISVAGIIRTRRVRSRVQNYNSQGGQDVILA